MTTNYVATTTTEQNAYALRRWIKDAITAKVAAYSARSYARQMRERYRVGPKLGDETLSLMYEAADRLDAAAQRARWNVYALIDPDAFEDPDHPGEYRVTWGTQDHIRRVDTIIERETNRRMFELFPHW